MFKEDGDLDDADTVETRPKTGYHKQIVSLVSHGVRESLIGIEFLDSFMNDIK